MPEENTPEEVIELTEEEEQELELERLKLEEGKMIEVISPKVYPFSWNSQQVKIIKVKTKNNCIVELWDEQVEVKRYENLTFVEKDFDLEKLKEDQTVS